MFDLILGIILIVIAGILIASAINDSNSMYH